MNPRPQILIVEDEPQIRCFVRGALLGEGWAVTEAAGGRDGLVSAGTDKPDLVILDLGLPDIDGKEFILDFRTWSAAPILILSARAQEEEKVRALDAGADDYLSKPFGIQELLARSRALLRRQARDGGEGPRQTFGDVTVDLARRQVTRAGEAVHLTPLEYRLLAVLLAHAGKVMTHNQLLREVWGPGHAERSHYLRVYVGRLRAKLEADPAQPRHLLTETGVGFRFQF